MREETAKHVANLSAGEKQKTNNTTKNTRKRKTKHTTKTKQKKQNPQKRKGGDMVRLMQVKHLPAPHAREKPARNGRLQQGNQSLSRGGIRKRNAISSFSQVLHQLFGKTRCNGVKHAKSALDCRDRLPRSNKLRLQQSTLHWIDSLVAAHRRRLLPALTEFLDTRRGPGSGRPSGTVILRYCGCGTHPASHDIRTE